MGDMPDSRPHKNSLPTVGEVAEMAARGDDFSSHYTRRCFTIKPIRRVNVHFTERLLRCIDEQAAQLNVSREAAINILLRQAIIQQPHPKQPQSQPQSPARKTA